jgi:hypothetical protein
MRNRMTREIYVNLYIPKDAVHVKFKNVKAEAYLFNDLKDRPTVAFFSGRKAKPDFYHYYPTTEKRDEKIRRVLEGMEAHEERKAASRAARNSGHGVEVGDILVGSWGYDQTNVDFFKVKKIVGKTMVEVVSIGSKLVETTGPMAGRVVADPDAETKKTYRVKLSNGSGKSPVYGRVSKWDGKPMYESHYA